MLSMYFDVVSKIINLLYVTVYFAGKNEDNKGKY